MEKEKNLLCKQSNFFIRFSNQTRLTLNQKKILMYCLAKTTEIAKQNIDNIDYQKLNNLEIDLKDYMQILYDLKLTKNKFDNFNYKRLKNDLESIRAKTITIDYTNEKNEKIIIITGIIHRIKMNLGSWKIKILWDDEILKDFIKIMLDKNFTLYKLDTFLKINNKYGQRIYEIAKSYEGLGEVQNNKIFKIKYDIETLCNLLLERDEKTHQIICKSYLKNSYFLKNKVLEPAKNSILKSGVDIEFDYKKIDNQNFEFIFNYKNSDKQKSLIKKDNYQKYIKSNKKYFEKKLDPNDDYDKKIINSVLNKDFK